MIDVRRLIYGRGLGLWLVTAGLTLSGCRRAEPERSEAAAPSPPPATAPAPDSSSAPAPPRPLPAVLVAAIEAIGQGRYEEAQAILETYRETHPDDAQAVFVHALAFHRARRYAEAAPLFEQALEMDASDVRVQHFLGYCRFYLGELDRARSAFTTHLQYVPDESDSHFGLGLVELEEGHLDAAEARFTHAIEIIRELEQTNPPLYAARASDLGKCNARLGDIAFARTEYEKARTLYLEAVGVNPNLYAVYHALSQTYLRLGNDAEAARMTALYEQMLAARQRRLAQPDLPR